MKHCNACMINNTSQTVSNTVSWNKLKILWRLRLSPRQLSLHINQNINSSKKHSPNLDRFSKLFHCSIDIFPHKTLICFLSRFACAIYMRGQMTVVKNSNFSVIGAQKVQVWNVTSNKMRIFALMLIKDVPNIPLLFTYRHQVEKVTGQ